MRSGVPPLLWNTLKADRNPKHPLVHWNRKQIYLDPSLIRTGIHWKWGNRTSLSSEFLTTPARTLTRPELYRQTQSSAIQRGPRFNRLCIATPLLLLTAFTVVIRALPSLGDPLILSATFRFLIFLYVNVLNF